MQQKLFGTSGIRGIVNRELTPEIVVKIGLAVATTANSGKVIVAYDTRTSSPMIEHSLTAGLQAGGSTVYRLGLLPTPTLAYLTRELKADTGIMITASHNPPQYNGLKLFNQDTTAYNEEQQNQIEKTIKGNIYKRTTWQNIDSAKSIDESKEGYYCFLSGTDEQCKKALEMIKAKNPKTGEEFVYATEVTGEEKVKVIKSIKEESDKASEAFGSLFG